MREGLLKVEKPGRYVDMEIFAYRKQWSDADVRWVLVFPDVYEVGLSHLGLRIIYHRLNAFSGVLADRTYTPWPDWEEYLRRQGRALTSLEHSAPLDSFDFVGFSLQYELSYTNILTALELSKIPLRSEERTEKDPFVIAGGPCVFHGEPVAEVFDLMILGEGEEVVSEIIDLYRQWKREGGTREDFLREARLIRGVYVPAFFSPEYSQGGDVISIAPKYFDYRRVEKRIISNLDFGSPLHNLDLVPIIGIVHDRFTVEIARGCTRGCRFCQAGYMYRPVREHNPKMVLKTVIDGIRATGYEEASLLSLSAGDYTAIQVLLPAIMRELEKHRTAVSLPSLRVGTLTEEMVSAIKSVRKTGFTLAPEAGSERLRRVINKNISKNKLITTAQQVFNAGWRLIKLYFMIGLPTENPGDIEDIISLCREIWTLGKPHRARLHVSVSTFVPKPHTPFQWWGQAPRREIEEKVAMLKERLKSMKGVSLKWHDPGQSFWEAVMARGDRRLFRVICDAWQKGARMDGWTEQFKESVWWNAAASEGVDPEWYANRSIDPYSSSPWDHLSSGVDKLYLQKEYKKACNGEYTEDCRFGGCTGCGVCDFHMLKPVTVKDMDEIDFCNVGEEEGAIDKDRGEFWYRFVYHKRGDARFFSQTDIQRMFSRAVRRAAFPVAYSQGFHSHPKLSFVDAIPIGMESTYEIGYIAFVQSVEPQESMDKWNSVLPDAVQVVRMEKMEEKPSIHIPTEMWYRIEGLSQEERQLVYQVLRNMEEEMLLVRKPRGTKTLHLNDVVAGVSFPNSICIVMGLRTVMSVVVRPHHVLEHLGLSKDRVSGLRIIKMGYSQYDGESDNNSVWDVSCQVS